jgi:hypothetical protein
MSWYGNPRITVVTPGVVSYPVAAPIATYTTTTNYVQPPPTATYTTTTTYPVQPPPVATTTVRFGNRVAAFLSLSSNFPVSLPCLQILPI